MSNIKDALLLAYEEKIECLEKVIEKRPEPVFSERFNKKVSNLIDATDRSYDRIIPRKRRHRYIVWIAVILVITMTATAVAIVRPEIKYTIKKTIREWELRFDQSESSYITNEFKYARPEVPYGYVMSSEEKGTQYYSLTYEDGTGKMIIYTQETVKGSTMGIDSEYTSWEDLEIGDDDAILGHHIFNDKEEWILLMNDGYYMYTVSANESKETIISVAKGINAKGN